MQCFDIKNQLNLNLRLFSLATSLLVILVKTIHSPLEKRR